MARLESIRILMSIACTMNFKLYQMDVKCAFLNGYLNEEVFVEQPKGFEDPHIPDQVLRLKKALYGLKQAPRAWYDRLIELYLSRMMKCPLQRNHHHEWLKTTRKVTLLGL